MEDRTEVRECLERVEWFGGVATPMPPRHDYLLYVSVAVVWSDSCRGHGSSETCFSSLVTMHPIHTVAASYIYLYVGCCVCVGYVVAAHFRVLL